MQPTIFLSHGSPMHALNAGEAGDAWIGLANSIATPTAILIVTAHWETAVPTLSGSANPPMIYDFGGFPDALYKIQYRAPGDPKLAATAAARLTDAGIRNAVDTARGFDHGSWVPLLRMYPDAQIPVVQLSVQPTLSPMHHFQVGRALAGLADDGVLIIGSGHLTHNLRDWMMSRDQNGRLAYAVEFQQWVHDQLTSHNLNALSAYRVTSPQGLRAHPTPEHFLPLSVAWGAAGGDENAVLAERVFDGFEGAALAMDAYKFSRPYSQPALTA
jgi:4,5-DOPA dioxygenase extradiol